MPSTMKGVDAANAMSGMESASTDTPEVPLRRIPDSQGVYQSPMSKSFHHKIYEHVALLSPH